jgi:hypothetical protein
VWYGALKPIFAARAVHDDSTGSSLAPISPLPTKAPDRACCLDSDERSRSWIQDLRADG